MPSLRAPALLAAALLLAAAPAAAAAAAARAAPLDLSDKDAFYLLVVNEKCWDTYFTEFAWLSPGAWADAASPLRACVPNTVGKALGYGIVAGGVAVNALQVHGLYSQGHAAGMNMGSQYQTLWSNLLGAAYMYLNAASLDKYGEMIVQAAGPAVTIGLMWRWQRPRPAHALAVLALTAACGALFLARPVEGTLRALLGGAAAPSPQAALLAVYFLSQLSFWASRLGQIYTTHAAGSDVSQSIVALTANGLGSLVRVFSTQDVVGIPPSVKPVLLAVSLWNTSLNWVMVAQWAYYNAGAAGGRKGGSGGARGARPAAAPPAVPQPPRRSAAIAAEGKMAAASSPQKRAGGRKRE